MYQPPYFIKKFISTNRSRVKDPHFLAKKQQKMPIFEKSWILGPKRPPRGASPTWNMYLYGGHLFQPFWTKKNRPGWQEGPKTAKFGLYLYLQKYPILAVFGTSCQPGRIFLVQNGWKRCPAYRYMFHVGLAPLGGLLGPNIQFFQKYPFFAVFWLKNGGLLRGNGWSKWIFL